MTLLSQAFNELIAARAAERLWVEDLALGAEFVVVRLSDGAIGSSLNYLVQNGVTTFDPVEQAKRCFLRRAEEPLLHSYASSHDVIETCIATAIATALSQPLLSVQRDDGLQVRSVDRWQDHFQSCIRSTDVVCQVGFGGATDICARRGAVAAFVVCDLGFDDPREIAKARTFLEKRGLDPSGVSFEYSALQSDILEQADVVCITGSALCNGTLDRLLSSCSKARTVVLQGPSCSLYAPCLFSAGVSLVYAPLKTPTEWMLAGRRDPLLNEAVDGAYVMVTRSNSCHCWEAPPSPRSLRAAETPSVRMTSRIDGNTRSPSSVGSEYE